MKINVFRNSASSNSELLPLLAMFAGLKDIGENVYLIEEEKYDPCDIAVIFGSFKDRPKRAHHRTRLSVKHNHMGRLLVIETPLINRTMAGDQTFARISFDTFVADTGFFNNSNRPADRFNKFVNEYGLVYSPEYNKQGNEIIITLQLPGDASLRGADIYTWALDTATEIRKYSDRKIIFRLHPHDKRMTDKHILKITNSEIYNNTKSLNNNGFANAYCVITYTSGYGVEAALAGITGVTLNSGSFVYNLFKDNSVENIENLSYPDRTQWLYDMAYTTWHLDEIEKGLPWCHLMSD